VDFFFFFTKDSTRWLSRDLMEGEDCRVSGERPTFGFITNDICGISSDNTGIFSVFSNGNFIGLFSTLNQSTCK